MIRDSGTSGALQRLGLKYRHETFGERNAVEVFLGLRKGRRGSGAGFLPIALLILYRAG